jgi:hypothetical protein
MGQQQRTSYYCVPRIHWPLGRHNPTRTPAGSSAHVTPQRSSGAELAPRKGALHRSLARSLLRKLPQQQPGEHGGANGDEENIPPRVAGTVKPRWKIYFPKAR